MASGFCLFMLIEFCLNGKLILCKGCLLYQNLILKSVFFCLDKVIRIQLCGNVLSQVINYGEFKHWLMVV